MAKQSPEVKMWERLRRDMGKRWHAERMESKFAPGIADVNFTMRPFDMHEAGWLELKALPELPKREDTPIRIEHFTQAQVDWLCNRRAMGQFAGLLLWLMPSDTWLLYQHREALQQLCDGELTLLGAQLNACYGGAPTDLGDWLSRGTQQRIHYGN